MIHVIRFTAIWCNPCKALAPVFKELEATMSDIKFSTIDIEAQPDIAAQYKVRSIPTVIIEKDDAIVQSIVGLQSKQTYVQAIARIGEPVMRGKFKGYTFKFLEAVCVEV